MVKNFEKINKIHILFNFENEFKFQIKLFLKWFKLIDNKFGITLEIYCFQRQQFIPNIADVQLIQLFTFVD
jgi:hypothetical protein